MSPEIQKLVTTAQALHDDIDAARKATETAGGNPSWLLVARGCLAKAVEQIGLHGRLAAPVPAANPAVPGSVTVPAAPTTTLPAPNSPAQVAGEFPPSTALKDDKKITQSEVDALRAAGK